MDLEILGIWGGFWLVVFNAGSLRTKPCCPQSAQAELEQRHRGEQEPVQRFAAGLGAARRWGGLGGSPPSHGVWESQGGIFGVPPILKRLGVGWDAGQHRWLDQPQGG